MRAVKYGEVMNWISYALDVVVAVYLLTDQFY